MPDENRSTTNTNQPTTPPIIEEGKELEKTTVPEETVSPGKSPGMDIPPDITTSGKGGGKFGGKKVIASILGILFLVGGIGAGVILVQRQQDIREKAKVKGPCNICVNTTCETIAYVPDCKTKENECSDNEDCDVPTPTPAPTSTPTPTGTGIPTPTGTATPTATPTSTPTLTSTPIATPTSTPTPIDTSSPIAEADLPEAEKSDSITYTCNTTCTTNAQCEQANEDYICYAATNTCRQRDYPEQEDCAEAAITTTITTPTPTDTSLPIAEEPESPKAREPYPVIIGSIATILLILIFLVLAL